MEKQDAAIATLEPERKVIEHIVFQRLVYIVNNFHIQKMRTPK